MSDNKELCGACGEWNDENKTSAKDINCIYCSACQQLFHCFCVRIDTLEFAKLTQPEAMWFCPKCKSANRDEEDRWNALQTQIANLQTHTASAVNNAIGRHVSEAISNAMPTLQQSIHQSILAALENRVDTMLDDRVKQLEIQLEAKFEEKLNKRIEATINHLDTRSIADETRQKTIEVEVSRIVQGKLTHFIDAKMAHFQQQHDAAAEKLRDQRESIIHAMPQPATGPVASDELAKINDKLERQIRGAHLIIRNIPSECDAGQIDLRNVVVDICKKANINISLVDLRTAVRFSSSKQTIRPIIVKFYSIGVRDDVFRQYLRNTKLFTLKYMGLGSCESRIYINEDLTETNLLVFNRARQLKFGDNAQLSRVITKNGLVYVAQPHNGSGLLVVHSLAELDALVEQPPPPIVTPGAETSNNTNTQNDDRTMTASDVQTQRNVSMDTF